MTFRKNTLQALSVLNTYCVPSNVLNNLFALSYLIVTTDNETGAFTYSHFMPAESGLREMNCIT